jgi:hypothetical protein
MTQERNPRAIIFFKDIFEFVIFSDPNVDVMIAHAGDDTLLHETQLPSPEWLMNDATEVVERKGGEPPSGADALDWVQRKWAQRENALIEEALSQAKST